MADRGSFHLGKILDSSGKPGPDDLVIGSSDLTTHGVVVGMTGSGKTGLAVILLEEALLAGIPALIIDPKGDMGNLALTFPDLSPASFQPWVNASEAQAEGITVEALAEKTATTWREGLAAQGIEPERIQQLRDAADVTIYTPGSAAGVPLNVIGSLRAPTLSWDTEAETLRDEIEGTVTSLLGLIGIAADPLSSREHVLLSNLIENAWRAGRDLDLGTLIGEIQSPPLRKLGVFGIDAFFPPKDRTELALKLNALIASPAFAAWGEGASLDPQSLLFTTEGKPRAAIVYLAHLSDEERMFVTTLVFAKLVTWMRGQAGTADLRALAYMDEVAGYVPRRPCRLPRSRSSRSSSRVARSGSGSSSRRRTPSISTTRRCRTPVPGSSGGCKRRTTRRACSRDCDRPPGAPISRRSMPRSGPCRRGNSCWSRRRTRNRGCSPPVGPCPTCAGR